MKKLRIHYLQHVAFEGPGSIEQWALERGHSLTVTRFYESNPLPEMDNFDWLIIMGGPMGVYDEERYSWLKEEKQFIRQCIDSGKTVIGICLGAQLIATALGARVYPNKEKEIGWFPVRRPEIAAGTVFNEIPDSLTVFHWHGDTFDLPEGAIRLAETTVCKNQAFIYQDNIVGLQFHLEVTEYSLKKMVEHCRNELTEGIYVQTEREILEGFNYYAGNRELLSGIFERLAECTALN